MKRMVVLVLTLVAATACEEINAAFDDIRAEHGVDLRNPADAASAVSGADAIGNKDAENGLEVMKGFRREEHTAAGDKLAGQGKYDEARREYDEALRWTEERPYEVDIFGIKVKKQRKLDPVKDALYLQGIRDKQSALTYRIGDSYEREGDQAAGRAAGADARRLYSKAAAKYEQAANMSGDHTSQGNYLVSAAYANRKGGDDAAACRQAQLAASLGIVLDVKGYCS